IGGQRLADVISPGGMPIDDVLRYGAQIADALAYAHQQGVGHRDLKTTNVAITSEGRAKVIDFGLARRLRRDQLKAISESSSSVDGDAFAGTLSCMAPEVLRGEQDDERSDVWGLGVVMYEMATGARP